MMKYLNLHRTMKTIYWTEISEAVTGASVSVVDTPPVRFLLVVYVCVSVNSLLIPLG